MRLIDLKAQFSALEGRHGMGVVFTCPCRTCTIKKKRDKRYLGIAFVPFSNPIDGGPPFEADGMKFYARSGDSLKNLSVRGVLQSHGGLTITNGRIVWK